MKLPDWDHKLAFYDEWRRMHNNLHGSRFVQFETGELVTTKINWEPHERRHYNDLNVSVFFHTDKECPVLFNPENGEAIPKAWLGSTAQILLIDHDTKHVVKLHTALSEHHKTLPSFFTKRTVRQTVRAYFPGPELPPLGYPVRVTFPIRLTPEERQHIHNLKAACKMWFELDFLPKQGDRLFAWPTQAARVPDLLQSKTLIDVPEAERIRLVKNGTAPHTRTTDVPYLLINR